MFYFYLKLLLLELVLWLLLGLLVMLLMNEWTMLLCFFNCVNLERGDFELMKIYKGNGGFICIEIGKEF